MEKKATKAARELQQLPVPTVAELRLLRALWQLGEGTVEEVVQAHPAKERPHYKTTQTLLRIMEQKGFIAHEARGRVFVFRPTVEQSTVDRISVQALVRRNFNGSAAGLVMNLLEANSIKKKELDELEAYMREYRRKHGPAKQGPAKHGSAKPGPARRG